ncbi:Receptor-like protein 2 [Morella rubra]|uniref:Receptor-like protein 2 n=1 Tax=Morella rubra TaxID=262757 RepID=A0A6A1UIT2_9ROSI|nr:Receptor-like protein 2 [Morella rubra]
MPTYINILNNDLSGKNPDQISDLINLEILDLSANQLIVEIPASLANLHFLHTFSITSNKLQGPIPSVTQLQSFDASDYEGNPGLCSPPLLNQCPHIAGNKGDRDIHDEEKGACSPMASYKCGAWLHYQILGSLWFSSCQQPLEICIF